MRSGPRFSILMPTRNRARLLRLALRSALELRGDDYEVVVSDNCSADETREVVEALGDSRVRYVRTPRPMAMSENMEFVLGCAQGEHVTFLNDDDALVPGTLDSARGILDATPAQLVAWPHCHYYYPDWYEFRYRNCLVARPHSGRIEEVRARDTLSALYRDLDPGRLPTCTNVVCHRALIQRARRRVSRLFPLLSGDMFCGILTLAEVSTYFWMDAPLTIFGRWSQSIGSTLYARRGDAGLAYIHEFPDEATLPSVPLRTLTVTNLLAEALLKAKSALGPDLVGIELDWAQYFVRYHRDLMYQHTQGADVRSDLSEFHAVLATQPGPVRDAAAAAIRELDRGHGRSWRRAARRLVNQVPFLGWVEGVLRPTLKAEDGGLVVRGSQSGFADILECARFWDRLLSERRAATDTRSASQLSAKGA